MTNKDQRLIGGIQRFSTEDGPGIRTTLFFKGCPLGCKWCHNPELISSQKEILYYEQKCIKCGGCAAACPHHVITFEHNEVNIDRENCRHCATCTSHCFTGALKMAGEEKENGQLIKTLLSDKTFYEQTGGGVTLSGGEVTFQADYAHELEEILVKKGIDIAIDTCGHCKYENLEKLCKDANHILFDIKCFNSQKHKELTGVNNELIIDNLRKLAEDADLKSKIIIRMPLIHLANDSLEEINQIGELLNEIGLDVVNLIPYHELGTGKAKSMGLTQDIYTTPSDEHLDEMVKSLAKRGLHVTVMGRE